MELLVPMHYLDVLDVVTENIHAVAPASTDQDDLSPWPVADIAVYERPE